MTLEQIQTALQGMFDSVEETRDDTYIARGQCEATSTAEGNEEMRQRLRTALPNAATVSAGNVRSRQGRIAQWWVEFVVEE